MGQSPPGHTYNDRGEGVPFIQGSAEFGAHHPTPLKWCTEPRKIATPGDVLLSVRAPVGDTNVADQEIATGRGLAIIRGRDRFATTSYLRLALEHGTAQLLERSGSGMFTSITGAALKSLPMHLPPLDEQRRIVDLIGSLDDAIETAERSVESGQALLLARAGALHEEWASSFEALGSIAPPKALIGGPFGSSLTRKHYSAEGVPVIRGANMSHRGPYVGGEFVFVLEEKADELRRNEARPGDVIFTQRGTLGQVSLVPDGEYDRYIISQSQMRLRVNPGRDLAKFVYYAFLAPQIVDEIISRNTATANPHINLGILASLQIPRPPLEDQRAAVELMDSLAATHDALKASVDRLRDLRSNLLTVLLSGEHEIPESYDKLMEEVAV